MSILCWNPDWNTGIEKIDAQHRTLFDETEKLLQAIHLDRSSEMVPELLAVLGHYVEQHFQDEEKLMTSAGYPGLESHRAEHRQMRTRLKAMVEHGQKDPAVLNEEAAEFFIDWLITHVDGEDREMAQYLRRWQKGSMQGR